MTARKPLAKDWRNRAQSDWTIATFQAYLCDEHKRRLGIPYTARSYAVEGRWLKTMLAEHGAEVLRKFIDACFDEYRPTREYPSLNFGFMFTYQRSRILPRVLAESKRKAHAEQAQEITDDALDWL